jgi:hydroxyacylglutathione hydrolase
MLDLPERVRYASRLTAEDFDARRNMIDGLQLLDIRNPGEVALGAIDGAQFIPVGQLPRRVGELDPSAPTVVYCAGGYRSSVAASVLREAGFSDVSDILGGYGAWQIAQAV